MSTFEFAVACEVFGVDRSDQGLPVFDFAICSPRGGPLQGEMGLQLIAPYRLEPLATADLVVVPALTKEYRPGPALTAALHACVARGGRVVSLCSGVYVLAAAGLLTGRRATAHWRDAADLASRYPQIEVVPDVLFVEDGPIATSAGTAAGIDLCLHLVRQSHGPSVANGIARRMVVPPQREGGQAQYVETPIGPVSCRTLGPVLEWAQLALAQDLSVEVLAGRAAMSPRSFARRFKEETGTTPHHWVLAQRVALAEQLLEGGDLSIEEIATRCGFGSATMLRHHFGRLRGTAPTRYRRMFGGSAATEQFGPTSVSAEDRGKGGDQDKSA